MDSVIHGDGQFNGGRMVVMQVASLMEGAWSCLQVTLMKGEWSCYINHQFNGGRKVM